MTVVVNDSVKTRQSAREKAISGAVKAARKVELDLLQNMAGTGVIGELRQICHALLAVAQKYVPRCPAAFTDLDSVMRCAKALQNMELQPNVTARFKAASASVDAPRDVNSFDYRYLRNKSIAGFATIADLTAKPAAVGSPDYQNGVREGYRRASEIAILFLKDIQHGGFDGR